jgi:hypothetical protein
VSIRSLVLHILALTCLVFLVMVPVAGQHVTAEARVDSTDYLVGDWITVNVKLFHPAGIALQALVGDTLGGFTVISKDPVEQSDGGSSTRYIVSKYDSGTAVLPPIRFLYSLPGDTALQSVATNPLTLTIHTVAVDTSAGIKDLKPPLSIPYTLAEVLLYVGIVVLVAVLAVLAYRYWKKRQQKIPGAIPLSPPRPAHVIALEQLGLLREKKLWQQGLIKEYYSEVTEIIRLYIENRYHVRALEQTTDEILAGVQLFPLPVDIPENLGRILRRADLVKFAKFVPGIPEHEEMMTIAYDIVDRTKLVVPAGQREASRTVQEAQADVGT